MSDEYTYYAEGQPKVPNALVRVAYASDNSVARTIHARAGGLVVEATTPDSGELELEQIVEGYYTINIAEEEHSPYQATIQIKPGQRKVVNAFMARKLVTYSWTVVPTTIEDTYTFTIHATFETNVSTRSYSIFHFLPSPFSMR